MALTRRLPVLLLLLVAMAATAGASEDRSSFCVTKCYPPPTPSADGGSAFRGNLLRLLDALSAAPTGFASLRTAGGAATDRASVRGFCFADSAPEPCRRCLSDAGRKITGQCGGVSRRGAFWDDRCFLGYADGANSSSSGVAGDEFGAVSFSGDAVPSPDVVGVLRLVALARSLAPRAAHGSVVTADATTTSASKGDATAGNRTVRVLAQCARDRSAAGCVGCLREASQSMARSWDVNGGPQGRVAAVLGSNCYLRFETLIPLGEKIRRVMKDNLVPTVVVGVVIVMVVGVVIIHLCDRREIKARTNRNAAAAAAAPAVEAMSEIKTMN